LLFNPTKDANVYHGFLFSKKLLISMEHFYLRLSALPDKIIGIAKCWKSIVCFELGEGEWKVETN
jgi:hypothetical protein